jgi:hypothetical protein
MNVTPEQREQIRLSLLRYGLGSFTVGLARQYLASEGFRGLSKEEVQAEINYLCDPAKGLLRANSKLISPEVATYSTTATGSDFLAQNGIAD